MKPHYCIRRYDVESGKSLGVMDYSEVAGLGLRGLKALAARLNSWTSRTTDYRVERYWKQKEQK